MSQLVYLRAPHGAEAQIWHGPPYICAELMTQLNSIGNLMFPSLGGERIIERIDIKDGEEGLGIDELRKIYPLST